MAAPLPHEILNSLTKARLLELARVGLELAAARPKAQVVDLLAKSRDVAIAPQLRAMMLDDLKQICRALGLKVPAREKRVLIDRTLGVEASAVEEAWPGYQVTRTDAPTPRAKRGTRATAKEGPAPNLRLRAIKSTTAPAPELVLRFTGTRELTI